MKISPRVDVDQLKSSGIPPHLCEITPNMSVYNIIGKLTAFGYLALNATMACLETCQKAIAL